ncbi:hypothetical protein OIU76_005025 [Salix suchowensis]|uniref:Uncharacterized protein n=1 Tax=Salix suchowensis TaxID=1278906 RepID=A0ABQ9ACP9_9ROSI|nr:hypothetical protein OIU77_011144 [Salix suchowensis]KAJ6343207.1 hypothetical protein OIU76_005025 [Salix suchowensis]
MKSLPATSSPHHPIKTKPRSKVVALKVRIFQTDVNVYKRRSGCKESGVCNVCNLGWLLQLLY